MATINMASVAMLFFIWVLPETIALRHLLLAISFVTSIFIIRCNPQAFLKAGWRLAPILVLGFLFIWVALHFFLFSLNPDLELSEIMGLWPRTFAGYVIAIALGLSLRKYPDLLKPFYFSIFFTPLINIGSYLYLSYLYQAWAPPGAIVRFLYTKSETAYFGAIGGAVAVASLISLLSFGQRNSKNYLKIFLCIAGLTLVLVSSILSATKNGFAIAIALILFLVLFLITHAIFQIKIPKLVGFGITCLSLLLLGFGIASLKSFPPGWNTLLQDVAVSVDIDGNKQWQKLEGSVPAPLNSLGSPAAMNTYERVAWARVGIRLIGQYPLGYGSINSSFVGLQKVAQIPNENQGQTHSGWVDFGLAFGIPGLLIVFSSLVTTIYLGLKSKRESNLVPIFICLTLIPFCLISEVSWKQYFESLIFFITLCGSLVIFNIYPPIEQHEA